MDAQASNGFWTSASITTAHQRQVLKARYGQVWTMRKARLYGMPYFRGGRIPTDIKCPLCGLNDSTGHMLGECMDADMKSIYIERHNEAARMILGEVMKGEYGNRLVCMDVGSSTKVAHLNEKHTRIPNDVISDQVMEEHGMPAADRNKLRPDALIIESNIVHVPQTGKRDAQRRHKPRKCIHDSSKDPPTRPCKAYIIEVGYAAETRYVEKVQAKIEQHAQLCKLLEASGFEPVIQPMVLGTTGGIFNAPSQLARELGVDKDRLKRLNNKLHVHSVKTMHSIIKLRRTKEVDMHEPNKTRRKKPPDK